MSNAQAALHSVSLVMLSPVFRALPSARTGC
jgi:hypothetical protein